MRLALALALAACSGHAPPPASHPPVAEPAVPLEQALARIEQASFRRDLDAVVGPRDAFDAPEHLAEVAAYIERELTAAGLRVERQPVEHGIGRADNLIADRPGRSDSVVIVAAHYDSVPRTPGADDNASGVAALLAAARATRGVHVQSTLRFIAFSFEEYGLVGSRRYAQSLSGAERERIRTALVMDMIGYRTREPSTQTFPPGTELLVPGRTLPTVGDFIGVLWLAETPPDTVAALERAIGASEVRVEALPFPSVVLHLAPDLRRGDHASFWDVGVPAIVFNDTAEYRTPHYHRPSDTIETMDVPFAVGVARLVTRAAVELAREEPPRPRGGGGI